MSTNLRLSAGAAAALREAARQSGRSQQDLLREAVDRYLGLNKDASARDRAVGSGLVKTPTPLEDLPPAFELPHASTLDLLDRDER